MRDPNKTNEPLDKFGSSVSIKLEDREGEW